MAPNSESLCVSADDFRRSRWKKALESAGEVGYSAMAKALFSAAQQAEKDGDLAEMKVLKLLANACSMVLCPESTDEPFEPCIVMNDRRSASLNDFHDEEIELFSEIVEEIDHVWLRARIADLVWVLKRDYTFARGAIDSYTGIRLDDKTWWMDGRECWYRAIDLTKRIERDKGDLLKKIEKQLFDCLKGGTLQDGLLTWSVAELMLKTEIGGLEGAKIAAKLRELGMRFESGAHFDRAGKYFDASATWFRKVGYGAEASEATVRCAETFVKNAEAQMSGEQPLYSRIATLCEEAIKKYREIPNCYRSRHNVDERIAQLFAKLTDAYNRFFEQMRVILSPPLDIGELVENARDAVRGKTALEGLRALATVHPGACVRRVRETAEEWLREQLSQAFFPMAKLSRDGRVVAKSSALDLDKSIPEDNGIVWVHMVRYHTWMIDWIVDGFVLPALEALRSEHSISEKTFIDIADKSCLVPPNRGRLFGKALFAGYNGDFVAAIHLLVPQIENMVRWHLQLQGVRTTASKSEGIEEEKALGSLMKSPETKQIFGQDIAFELKTLLCDPFGPNLRNQIAHGLLDYEACESVYAVYTWWLGLRLVFFSRDKTISQIA
jgi:predicted nucleic-acid-binding protein